MPSLSTWIIRRSPLPPSISGDICWPTKTITIDPTLSATVQRCTLAHELIHASRGPLPDEPTLAAREELAVEKATARALIDVRDLGEALAESPDPAYVSSLLDVDVALLTVRLDYLHPSERSYLAQRLAKTPTMWAP